MLKTVIDKSTYDSMPADIQKEYSAKGENFELQLDGAVTTGDRDRLQEALRKERNDRETLEKSLKRYGKVTPEEATRLGDEIADLRMKLELSGANPAQIEERVSKLVESKLAVARRPLEQQLAEHLETNKTLAEKVAAYERADRSRKVLGALRDPGLVEKLGLKTDLMDDAYDLWVQHNFTLDAEGRVVTSDAFGTPGLPPETALKELRTEGKKRHLFGDTSGAGAGGGNNALPAGANPFTEEHFDLAKIGAVVRQNPAQATRLAVAATTKKHNAINYLPADLRPKQN